MDVPCTSTTQEDEGEVATSDDEYSTFYRTHPSAVNLPHQPGPAARETDEPEVEYEEQFTRPLSPFVPPSKRKDAPLSAMLNETLDCIDPRRFFPDFRPDKPLRFSRLLASNIKSTSKAEIWWTSKTFHKKPLTEEERQHRESGHHKRDKPKGLQLSLPPPPTEDSLIDQESQFLRTSSKRDLTAQRKKMEVTEAAQPWRFGPAKMWYDMLGIPALAATCSYGLKAVDATVNKTEDTKEEEDEFPSDTFLPVNLVHWEDDIVLDGDEIKQKVMEELKSGKAPSGGWIPTQNLRTYETFTAALKSGNIEHMFSARSGQQHAILPPDANGMSCEPTSNYSLFPMENCELLNSRWEDDVIWDDDDLRRKAEPKVLTLDLFDDPCLFGMPDDRGAEEYDPSDPKKMNHKEMQYTKKSKMILGQVAQRQKQEEEEQMESSIAQLTDKDPFNLSCDDYYMPKAVTKSGNALSTLIQHSIPAQNIHRTFFPTHLTPFKLRHWHRMPLSRRIIKQVGGKYVAIQTLARHIRKVSEEREKAKAAEGGGDIFFMREVRDLSGCDGDLVLLEYSEEHPILLSQPGMASRIRNYHKRKTAKDADPILEFGELAFAHNSPFLGQLSPGQTLQSVESNLARAPIHRHEIRDTDFLLIRTKKGYFIRRFPALFLVGQQSPLYEVPSPNSKRATVFVRDFLMAFIYRLFWASNENPRRLKMEDIKAAFPHYAESSVRKRLKVCSDFKRLGTGNEQNFWLLRSDFRLPTKEEVLAMVTPEMCCAQYAMLAAEQRLKDAGYGEKYFFTPEEGDDDDDHVTMEDEIKCAPWNTSRAFLAAMRGKCLLDQTGIADPSGTGHGYSYVRVSNKPQKDDLPQVPKRLVTGTNADLRKLPLKEAKEICRDYGVREEEISALSRWEIIDVIRTLSTQAAKAKSDFSVSGMARFARGNIRLNLADMQDKYKKHCQNVFEVQNSVLSNPEELSTDEGSSGEESDNEELANRLESMLSAAKGKKGISAAGEKARMEREDEERERRDLKRMLHGENVKGEKKEATEQERKNAENIGKDVADSASKISGVTANQKLKIYRTYRNPDGTESTRVEVITRPQLIEAYTRIRLTKDETFIQVYAQMDEQFKEERRKEKRRLQDQLRRIKRNEMKVKVKAGTPQPPKPAKPPNPNLLKMRCSACGGTGHMKTNKNCPLYGKRGKGITTSEGLGIAMTDEQMAVNLPSGELIAVEGTKVKISKKIYQHSEQLKRDSVKLHISRNMLERREEDEEEEEEEEELEEGDETMVNDEDGDDEDEDLEASTSSFSRSLMGSKRRPTWMNEDSDYLAGPSKSVQRIRADPRVTFATQLNEIVSELRNVQGAEHLMFAVNGRKVKDYYDIVKNPMDLQRIKMKITENKYELRKDFLSDVKQMLDNSLLYNGSTHVITDTAKTIFDLAFKRIMEKEQQLIKLEKQINPLLDENDLVGFNYILADIIQQCKNVPKSVPFHTKVDARKAAGYFDRVSRPMDLGAMERMVKDHRYKTIDDFMRDINQIFTNSELYNGPVEKSTYTAKALEIVNLAQSLIDEKRQQLSELERNMMGGVGGDEEGLDEGPDDIDASFLSAMDEEGEEEGDTMIADDLALSGEDEEEDEQLMDMDESEWAERLESSNMHSTGQMTNDLALSESDEELEDAKRPRMDDDLTDF